MQQMILSKTNKKQKQIMAKKSRLRVPKRERGGIGMERHFGVLRECKLLHLEWMGWDSTVQHREMCVIGSLCCKTERDKIL